MEKLQVMKKSTVPGSDLVHNTLYMVSNGSGVSLHVSDLGANNLAKVVVKDIEQDILTGLDDTTIRPGSKFSLNIVNYCPSNIYRLSATGGIVSRVGSKVQYTANVVEGEYSITLNDVSYPITIVQRPYIKVPELFNLHQNTTVSMIQLESTSFNDYSDEGTMVGMDWEVRLGSENSPDISSQLTINTDGSSTTILPTSSGQYHIRVRYVDSNGMYTLWSNYVAHTVDLESHSAIQETQNLSGTGYSIAVSSDGQTIVVGNYNGGDFVDVFKLKGASFEQVQRLQGTNVFGISVDICANGQVIVVGAWGVYAEVWRLQNGVYVSTDTFTGSTGFGIATRISRDASTIVIGADGSSQVYVYKLEGNNYNHIQTITQTGRLGYDVDVCADGTKLILGTYRDDSAGNAAYIYTYNGSTYTLFQKFTGDGSYGIRVRISDNGNVALVGSYTTTNFLEVWTLKGNKYESIKLVERVRIGWAMALSSDGSMIVAATNNEGTSNVYKLVNGSYILSHTVGSPDQGTSSLAMSGDGSVIAMGGGTVRVYV